MNTQRSLVAATIGYTPRTVKFNGRDHIVVPVVALVEGVIQAMNAGTPEFVAAEEFEKAPAGWNGRPVFVNHPLKDGVPVFGNQPDILEKQQVGVVFNAAAANRKLTMEAWIDVERAAAIAPDLLHKVQQGSPIEVSVGLLCETAADTGRFNGKPYQGAWKDLVPDHLALLSDGHVGACSREMGCGVRAASKRTDKTFGGMFARIMEAFRGAQPSREMTGSDLAVKLTEALRKAKPEFLYLETYLPVKNPNTAVYRCIHQDGESMYDSLYQRSFTLGADGAITLGETEEEVEPVLYYEPVKRAAVGNGCNQYGCPSGAGSPEDESKPIDTSPNRMEQTRERKKARDINRKNRQEKLDRDQGRRPKRYSQKAACGDDCHCGCNEEKPLRDVLAESVDELFVTAIGNGCNQYGCPDGAGGGGKDDDKDGGKGPEASLSSEDRNELSDLLDQEADMWEGVAPHPDDPNPQMLKEIAKKLKDGDKLTPDERKELVKGLDAWGDNQEDDIREDEEENQAERYEYADKIADLAKKFARAR